MVRFNIPLDKLKVILGRIYGSDDPTNSLMALKDYH